MADEDIRLRRQRLRRGLWPCFALAALFTLGCKQEPSPQAATAPAAGAATTPSYESIKAAQRARGYRLSPADFPDGDAIPRDQNAFNDFFDALSAINISTEDASVIRTEQMEKLLSAAPTPEETAKVQALHAANQAAWDKLDAIESRPQAVWPRKSLDPAWHDQHAPELLGNFVNARALLIRVALIAHRERRDADACHALRRALALCRVAHQAPDSAQQRVGLRTRQQVAEVVIHLLPTLDLVQAANMQETKHLLFSLQDDDAVRAGMTLGLEGDLARAWQMLDAAPGDPTTRVLNASDVSAQLAYAAAGIDVSRAATWQKAKTAASSGPPMPALTAGQNEPWIDQVRGRLIALAHARAAALLLAAQIHEEVQMGPSQTIGDLIDENLPRLPIDPFSEDAQPLHFRLEPAGVVIWSVGEDGKDDGGALNSKTDLVYSAFPVSR